MTKKFDLGDYLKKDEVEETIYKPMQYITMQECFQNAIGLPGVPMGHSTMLYGLSDSGKTDVMLKIAKEAVKQDILPIIIITENKLEKARLNEMGLVPKENCILEENLTTLEDVFDYISMKVEDIKHKRLKMNSIILWDSVAGTPSKESFEIDKEGRITKRYGAQKNAAVIGYYNPIIAKRISSTREMNCDYSLGLVILNQAYIDKPAFPGAPILIVPNGGEKVWYPLSLAIEVKEGKRIKTTINDKDLEIALVCRLKVKKNHINGIYSKGEVVLAGAEMFENDEKLIKEFKENYKAGKNE